MTTTHIRQDRFRGFACVCGGRFDAPQKADAAKVRDAANAWQALHEVCAPTPHDRANGPAVVKVQP